MHTVTIGIPAFNEEANIGHLISDLLRQSQSGFKLVRIIVASDGSNDKTVQIARAIKDKRILVINNKIRQGIAFRLNQICQKSSSDILVILNGDVAIRDNKFLDKLIFPIKKGEAHLTSSLISELATETFTEKVIAQSMKIKHQIYDRFQAGNSIYTCFGPARGFAKSLYKSIKFKQNVGEDAYSYFYCITHRFKFASVKNTQVFYKLPSNFSDHQKQSLRFFNSQKLMEEEFGQDLVRANYKIPFWLIFKELSIALFKSPFFTLTYLFMVTLLMIKSISSRKNLNTWEISHSSKILRAN